MKEITWHVEGSDVTHTIPEGSAVTFKCERGAVTISFEEEDGDVAVVYDRNGCGGELV